jgi:endonuclease-3
MSDDRKKSLKILKLLNKAYPDAPMTYLDHRNAFEMIIATILSAHTTDACVNKVTPELFKKYPDPHSLMIADVDDVIGIIRQCGTYNKKSDFIMTAASQIVEQFGGEVPKTMDELVTIKGVSRKTANVVLSVVFGINEGVVVDTHVMRVTQRLGFTKEQKNREKAEKNLMELLPQDNWYEYARLIGAHGRRTCSARRPKCDVCSVDSLCPSKGQV